MDESASLDVVVKEVFNAYDFDMDGLISKLELKHFLIEMMPSMR
jgi:Ca2+-binding EF-hand superfamily protein